LIAAVIGVTTAGPAMAEVCDKGGPVYSQPWVWLIAVLTGLALWRGGRVWPLIAVGVTLLIGSVYALDYLEADTALRAMTDDAIREGCRLPPWAAAIVFPCVAALALLRFRRDPL